MSKPKPPASWKVVTSLTLFCTGGAKCDEPVVKAEFDGYGKATGRAVCRLHGRRL